MKSTAHQQTLAALHALGALDGEEAIQFRDLLTKSSEARHETTAFSAVAEALAGSLPVLRPSPALRESILKEAQQRRAKAHTAAAVKKLAPVSVQGLAFLQNSPASGWTALPVAGAFVKLLSFDDASQYAVVLGKLEPGAQYPSHLHRQPEDIFMLSGDLHVGDQVIRAGDFHHADAGSCHGVNWSEIGCVLLCVLSKEDLLAQLVPA